MGFFYKHSADYRHMFCKDQHVMNIAYTFGCFNI